jgi:hypothetical protein
VDSRASGSQCGSTFLALLNFEWVM